MCILVHYRKIPANLNYNVSWSWSNQPVLWDLYHIFVGRESLDVCVSQNMISSSEASANQTLD